MFFLTLFVTLFVAVAEWLFGDEFGVRFNFIAIDYLVYSDEVLNNILESYPVGRLMGTLAVLAVVLGIVARRSVVRTTQAQPPSLRQRLGGMAAEATSTT